MRIALVCLLAVSTSAYAGDNRKCDKSCTGKTCAATTQASCKKVDCNKASCPGSNTSCAKAKFGMKKK